MLGAVAVLISFLLGCLLGIISRVEARLRAGYLSLAHYEFSLCYPLLLAGVADALHLLAYLLNWFPLSGGYDSANIDPGWSYDFIGSVIQHAFLPGLDVGGFLPGWLDADHAQLDDYNPLGRLCVDGEGKGLTGAVSCFGTRPVTRYYPISPVSPSPLARLWAVNSHGDGLLLPWYWLCAFQAVKQQDYAMVQSIFLFITLVVLGANFIADMLYAFLDPRVRHKGVREMQIQEISPPASMTPVALLPTDPSHSRLLRALLVIWRAMTLAAKWPLAAQLWVSSLSLASLDHYFYR